jgi:hypothetical protein
VYDVAQYRSGTPHLLNNAESWHKRAAEARSRARGMNDAAAKDMMLGIAASYERLAERAERRAKDRAKLGQNCYLYRDCFSAMKAKIVLIAKEQPSAKTSEPRTYEPRTSNFPFSMQLG